MKILELKEDRWSLCKKADELLYNTLRTISQLQRNPVYEEACDLIRRELGGSSVLDCIDENNNGPDRTTNSAI